MRSSRKMLEEFVKSAIWLDIKETLDDWIEGIKTDVFKSEDIMDVRRWEGRLEAVEYFLALPQTLMNSIEYEEGPKDGPGHDET